MDATDITQQLLKAAQMHVPFDGWSSITFHAAVNDANIPLGLAKGIFPREGLDLALASHRQGDQEMAQRLAQEDLSTLRFRDKIAKAILVRLSLADRESVHRATTLLALPQHAPDAIKALWGTADQILLSIGDTSQDLAWYSKRTSIATIYSATVLYWLGDDSIDEQATRDFLDRRIESVMRFEKAKANVMQSPIGTLLRNSPLGLLGRIKPPQRAADLPGHTTRPAKQRPF